MFWCNLARVGGGVSVLWLFSLTEGSSVSKYILKVFSKSVRTRIVRKPCILCFLEEINLDLILCFKVKRCTKKQMDEACSEISLINYEIQAYFLKQFFI